MRGQRIQEGRVIIVWTVCSFSWTVVTGLGGFRRLPLTPWDDVVVVGFEEDEDDILGVGGCDAVIGVGFSNWRESCGYCHAHSN